MHMRFWWGSLKKKTPARPRHGWQDIRIDLHEIGGGAWISLMWLRIGTNGRLS